MTAPRATLRILIAGTACALAALAAPQLTQVSDILYKADGTVFSGTATISWRSFVAADSSNIPTNSVTIRITNGILRARLVPTTNAPGNAYYIVRFNADGQAQFTELWAVPPSAIPVAVKDIRIPSPPGTKIVPPPGVVQMSDVVGLIEALADRPTKSIAFSPNRGAFIDAMGEIAAVSGSPGDCIRVDGTSGPCGNAQILPGFIDLESPAGNIDGVNAIFTLGQVPAPTSSLHLFRNGILQRQSVDFTVTGNAVTFLPASVPQQGDILAATYRTAGH